MKKFYLLAAMALSAFISCQTIEIESPSEQQVDKVPMTFNAFISMEEELIAAAPASKLEVGSVDTDNKVLKFAWKRGDRIALYDNISSTPNVFTADADGANTSFSGTVSAGATQFIAIYPYSAAVSANVSTGACEIDFPKDQTAVAGSFDPESLVSVGSAAITGETPNPSIRFHLIGALLSFSVDYDDVVFVEFSGSRPMSGDVTFTNTVGASGPAGVGTGTPNYKNVTLRNADGSPLTKGATYYVSVRHTGSNSQEGFTAKLITADAKVASRTGAANLQIARKTLYPLGLFSDSNVNFTYDRYAVYNAGFDVEIAGKKYNKATDGEATLLANGGEFKSSTSGVIFLDASANVTNASEATITSNVVLASSDPLHPATYTGTSGKSILLKSGSLVMDQLIVNMAAFSESGQLMTKKDTEGNFSSLTLWQCDFKNIRRSVYAPNSTALTYGVENILVNGCRFATTTSVSVFSVNSGATTMAGYKSFTFTNNVLYSTGDPQTGTYAFGFTGTNASESNSQTDLVMDNNLFYNIASSNGIFRTYYVKSAYIRNNVLWAQDGSYGSNIKMFKLNLKVAEATSVFTGASSDNYCFGDLGEKSWSISDSDYRGPLTNVTTLSTNPIASFSTSTGEFELVNAYKLYGPQLQPK